MMRYKFTVVFLLMFCFISGYSQGVWIDQNINPAPPQLNSVSTISHDICWAAGDGGTVIKTTNGGALWTNNGGGALGTGNVFVISAIDQNTALVGLTVSAPNATFIYRTTNSGQIWTVCSPFPQPFGFIDDIKMINSTTGYAYGDPVGGRWSIFKTTNGGISWDSSGMNVPQIGSEFGWWNAMTLYQAAVGGPVFIWFGTDQQRVYKSTNSGLNWTFSNIPIGIGSDIFSVTFLNPQTGFCGSNNAVCRTQDGGQNWQLLAAAPTFGPVNAFCYNSGYLWYSTDKFIYYSTDNGTSFVQQHTSTSSTEYRHMSFATTLTDNIESTVGGWGITGDQVISKYTHNNIGVQQTGTGIPKNYNLMQNYPNPFNPVTKIKFDLPHSGSGNNFVKLVIYDVNGREVTTLVNESLSPGSYETDWDASNYSSGIYIYKLVSGNYSETKKMILLK